MREATSTAGGGSDRDVRLAMYAPEDGGVNDHCIVRADDGWHYFFIYRVYEKWDGVSTTAGRTIGHAFSQDLFTWRTCPVALDVRPGTWESRFVWAPHVVRRDPYWYMVYAGVDDQQIQRLGIVRSSDLYRWERLMDTCALDGARFAWFDQHAPIYDCRDPYLVGREHEFILYYTARVGNDEPCIAAARSSDMIHWDDLGPVIRMFYPNADKPGWEPLESCCVFARQGLWYLVYQLSGICYHISQDPLNWHDTPAHTFSTNMWLFRWADFEQNLHVYKTQCFFGVLRFGLVRWDGKYMLPDHSRPQGASNDLEVG